ncbi:MAG TPA: DUF4159 domain-containing protein, partial [Gammaproteobacteria bacterium]|nr:DUF4159 domain-containing protein [Gammaproteobacteria bacterium]
MNLGTRTLGPLRFTLAIAASISSVCSAQGWGSRYAPEPNSNEPPATELVAARWRFGTNGAIGHMGWSHNYPYSEIHLNEFIENTTRIDVQPDSYQLLDLGSEEIFDHPFTYVSEPGEMELSEREAENLREYIRRGGFLLIDDFDGQWQLSNFQSQMRNVFPEQGYRALTIDNPIFDLVFEIDDLMGMAPYVPGGQPVYLGFLNEDGDVASVACYDNDLANFWDRIDRGTYPLRPSSDAFRMGINFIVYAMTH